MRKRFTFVFKVVEVSCFFFSLYQVLENDLQKKINTVQTLHEQVKRNLADFSSQRKQLEDYISQMSAWLKSMEDSLVSSPAESDPEDICRVKVQPKKLKITKACKMFRH